MELLLAEVAWMPTIVSFVVAFLLGWLWYSPLLFQKGWLEGIGISLDDDSPMLPAMLAQLLGTLLLAVIVGVTFAAGHMLMAILVGGMLAVIIIANGLFSQKSRYAIAVEAGYIVVMVAVMMVVQIML